MSTLMRDWIRPAVCKQLDEALQGTAQGRKASSSYSEDGTLMVHTTKGRAVQVNEFMSHAPPYLVLVSDSYTQIRAVFTKSSTDAFQREYKQPFSRGTNGAVLGITDFYLSPPSQRVMLRIEGFTLQGSEGSGNFGRPIPVEDGEVVTKLVSLLGKSFINGETGHSVPTSLIQSQASSSTDDSFFPGGSTQAGFSTQVPTKVLNGATSPRHTDSTAPNQRLLAALNRSKGQHASIRDPEPLMTSRSSCAPKPFEDHINGGSDSILLSSVSGQCRMISSTSTVEPIEPLTGSTKKRVYVHGDVPLSQVISESDMLRSPRFDRASDGDDNSVLLSRDISTSGRIESSIGPREHDRMPRVCKRTISISHQTQDNISKRLHDANTPWEGLTRIPRKYVQVPKDQRDILERDDVWHPPTPGRRQRGIILPPRILMELHAFHDGLGDKEDNEQSNSDSENDNDAQSNNQSGSCDEQGESRNGHSVQETGRRSVDGKRVSPSMAVSSNRDNFTGNLASSGPVSSSQGKSSVEDDLEFSEMDLKDETRVTNTKRPYVQIGKILPNGNILPDEQVDVSSASLDHGDESSVEETMSWASSPDRVELHSLRNHSSQEEPQGSANDDRSTSPNSFQSQLPLSIIPSLTLIDAESPSPGESDRESEVETLAVSNINVQKRPTEATERTTRALDSGLENSNSIFSSSPAEMELAVPYALGSENPPLDDIHMTDIFNGAKPVQSTRERLHLKFDLEGAPLVFTSSRSLHGKSHNVKADTNTKRRQGIAKISSDLIIPGTFRSEASNIFANPGESFSAIYQTTLEGYPLKAGQVISDTPGNPTRPYSDASSPVDGEKWLAQRQNLKLTESETSTQKVREMRSDEGKSPSVDNASRAPVDRQQFRSTSNIEISASATIHECSRPPLMGLQVSFSKSSPPPHSSIVRETIPSTIATPTKRRVSWMKEMIEHSAKRRRTLQTANLNGAPEKDSIIDPTEMAKANRRKFLQKLSLSSPIQSPHDKREDTTARFNVTDEAAAETFFENMAGDSVMAWSGSNSPTCPPHRETETPSVDLEKSLAQNSKDSSLCHSRLNEDTIDDESSEGKRNADLDVQKENTGLQQGTVLRTRERDFAESLRHGQENGSHTAVEVHPDDEHSSKNKNIFDMFNRAYPSYGKSLRAFIRPCVYLDWLHSTKNPLHPSLWDDFIRAFSSEYLDYIKDCEGSEENPMRAPEFYNTHVSEPIFMKRIMTPARLKEVLLLDPKETAKNHSKIHQKKCQKSRELMSTASSQISIASETLAADQETPISLHGRLYSTPQLLVPPIIMGHETSDNAKNDEIVSGQALDTVSALHSIISVKRPFFETPSQLITQGCHDKSSKLSTLIPGRGCRSSALLEGPSEHFGSLDFENAQANTIKQTRRHFPWSSSPHENMEINGTIPEHSNIRGQSPSSRKPPLVSPLRQREESSILDRVTSNSNSTAKQTLQSEVSSNLCSNLSFRRDPIFKTPNQPASKSLGRRTTNMPGPGENNFYDRRTSQRDESPRLLRMAKAPKTIISTSTATFKDFSKAFMPRQKRRTSGLGHVSTPSTDPRPSRIMPSGSKVLAEPNTQAWRF